MILFHNIFIYMAFSNKHATSSNNNIRNVLFFLQNILSLIIPYFIWSFLIYSNEDSIF